MTEAITTAGITASATDIEALRESIEKALKAGEKDAAIQSARALLAQQPGFRTWRSLRKLAEGFGQPCGLKPYKVALLSSFSIELMHDALIAYGFINGFGLELYQGDFGAFRQELLDEASPLYRWCPDVVILAVEGEDWAPEVFRGQANGEGNEKLVEAFRSEVSALVRCLRSRCKAPLLIHNFAQPAWRPLGILDANHSGGQSRSINQLNDALFHISQEASGVYLVDYAALTSRHGTLNWQDPRMRSYARMPIAQPMFAELAREYAKFFRSFAGFSKKCLVLDLDNTLWGGVVGEEGKDGIQLGPVYPGSAYLEFQQHVGALRRRGVILAIASKNNPNDVDEVFADHGYMHLRKEDFSDVQIHWERKSESLRRIAAKLDIGLEHMVFVDDSPAECEEVRRALPMVSVIRLPPNPEHYVRALHEDGWFDVLTLSEEDLRRSELYRQRASAAALQASSSSVEDYYRALDMQLHIAPVDRGTIKRTAQLTQKTNQLNVTTRRYSEAQLAELMQDPGWCHVTVGVTDRFGDNGIVGVMLARASDSSLVIDTLLLSCRVIGRGVETAMLAHLCDTAQRRGLNDLVGELIPTAKNIPVRDLFERHGFGKVTEDSSGASVWRLALPGQAVRCPDWFRVVGADTYSPKAEGKAA